MVNRVKQEHLDNEIEADIGRILDYMAHVNASKAQFMKSFINVIEFRGYNIDEY